ncbi:MAG: triple tyrosine motif-containing protein [Clostridiaceae bacterium]
MNEIQLGFNKLGEDDELSAIDIKIIETPENDLMYKFICGKNGIWETIRDYSHEDNVVWQPKDKGTYTVMVQGKEGISPKPFDYVTKIEYIVGSENYSLIDAIVLNSSKIKVGEKLSIVVENKAENGLFRFSIKNGDSWDIIKDYSADKQLLLTIKDSGKLQFLVEAKNISSNNLSDEFQVIDIEALPIEKLEIKDFKPLNSSLICGEELIFEVKCKYENERMVLYKFIKIDESGSCTVLQDYSTKKLVSYVEEIEGDYKILCLAKDMYSQNEFDDRAILSFKVKPYLPVEIKSFITDLPSPQFENSSISLKALATGGKILKYRYIIEGPTSYDSGYIRENAFVWKDHKTGDYKLTLYVKDISFKEAFEEKKEIFYTIEEGEKKVLTIKDVIIDKKFPVVIGEQVNLKVIAEGGIEPLYSFSVRKGYNDIEVVNYNQCNLMNFTPKHEGNYELEVRVKDKYSLKLYDCHHIAHFKVLRFLPSVIDHILIPSKTNFFVGDPIKINIVTNNAKETLIKYVIKINGHFVEESNYGIEKTIELMPRCNGRYSIEVYAKNKESDKDYDNKKSVKIDVRDAYPIVNTKIIPDNDKFLVNESITFNLSFQGGKEVLSEFYIHERGEWNLVQNFSRKHFYSFMPFSKGKYKLLALTKSGYINKSYEDYNIFEFEVK